MRNDSYTWPSHATLRFHSNSETEPWRLKTYVALRSKKYDGSNSSSTNVRYGDFPLSELLVGVDEHIITSCSAYFGYVCNGNVNAAFSRSISRAKPNDNLMIEEPFNCDKVRYGIYSTGIIARLKQSNQSTKVKHN